jgi:hypothetical protein
LEGRSPSNGLAATRPSGAELQVRFADQQQAAPASPLVI